MSLTTIPRSILRLQYQLVRLPLELIEVRVVGRLRAEAPARLIYERSLGMLDATVGSALGDPRLKRRGDALAERSDELSRAARLDAAATRKRAQAEAELQVKRGEAVEDRQESHVAKEQAVERARTAAEERKSDAAAAAGKRTAAVKRQADEVAAQRKASAEAAKRKEQERSRAAEKKVTDAARSKLKDATAKRDEAGGKRAQADRVEELADAEKQKRQTVRAGKVRQ